MPSDFSGSAPRARAGTFRVRTFAARPFRVRTGRRFLSLADRMASLWDENRPLETHEPRPVRLGAQGPHRHDALPGPGRRFAFRYYLRLRIDRVADENRRGQLDVVPAEIADRLLADVADAHADHHRERQAAIDQRLLELGFGRVDLVEVQG